MEKKDFGRLVAMLRKELRNEFDDVMSQADLAELARIPLITLQKIEQGRQANFKPDTLLRLADALLLNSSARQFFFLASTGITDAQLARPVLSTQDKLAELSLIISQFQTPAYLLDDFGDIVVINPLALAILNLEAGQLTPKNLSSQPNIIKLIFAPEFRSVAEMMGTTKSDFMRRIVSLYKVKTLKVRNHWYFQKLLPEFNRYPYFRELWQSLDFYDEDIYALIIHYNLNHPGLGLLRFMASQNLVMTTQGDLGIISFLPLDAHTAEACFTLSRKVATQAIPLAVWPKPAAPAGYL